MVAIINGMVCAVNPEGSKDRDGNPVPTVDLYSSGEVVKVRGIKCKEEHIGSYVDIPCKIQIKEFDGRKYLSVEAIPDNS